MRKIESSGPRARLPTLKALKTFEAAARLQSLTRAAEELNVTVSAVAFQVRAVEETMEMKVFRKEGRALRLTSEGSRLAADLTRSFAALDQAVLGSLARQRTPVRLTVSAIPSFASAWLLPNLPEFLRLHPYIEVRISTTERLVDLATEEIDCAIRCGPGGWPGVDEYPLLPQVLVPIAHRRYLEARSAPRRPSDLTRHSLIGNESRPQEWPDWLAAAGAPGLALQTLQEFDGRDRVLDAVRAGLGIGLVDRSTVGRDIEEGELVPLLGTELETGWRHVAVVQQGREPNRACRLFLDWLLGAAAGISPTKHASDQPASVGSPVRATGRSPR